MVSGVWDCLGLFFAVSGFFLVVVPAILNQLYIKSVRALAFKENAGGNEFEGLWLGWLGLWLIYYAVVVAGAAFLLWVRRRKTVIYNIDPAAFEKVLGIVVSRMGLERTRSAELFVIGPAGGADSTQLLADEAIVAGSPLPRSQPLPTDSQPALLRIDPFPALANVTLHWRDQAPDLRRRIEAELGKALKQVETQENPAANWILGIGGILLGFVFLIVLLLVLLAYFPPRRW